MSIEAVLSGRAQWHVEQTDVIAGLKQIPTGSISMVCTSPPYYGLRSYGTARWDGGDPDCDHDVRRWEGPKQTQGAQSGHAAKADRLDRPECRCGAIKQVQEVWGGSPDCSHLWGDAIQLDKRGSGTDDGETGRQRGESYGRNATRGEFCQLCSGWRGELGLEPTVDLFIAHLVTIFEEVRRVLRPDGVCFINIGDSYVASGYSNHRNTGGASRENGKPKHGRAGGLKPKDMALVPERLKIALQDSGWWIRSTIAWCKLAPMPGSQTDRPTSAWEPVIMATKSASYWYDAEAVRVPHEREWWTDGSVTHYRNGTAQQQQGSAAGVSSKAFNGTQVNPAGRNLWNYLLLGPEPLKEAHYAAFPSELVRTLLLAGAPPMVCPDPACGKPYWRLVERESAIPARVGEWKATGQTHRQDIDRKGGFYDAKSVTLGWQPGCTCQAGEPVGGIVLDPFAGSSTTIMVALRHGRRAVGLELNPAYVELGRNRVINDSPMWNQTPEPAPEPPQTAQAPLFPSWVMQDSADQALASTATTTASGGKSA